MILFEKIDGKTLKTKQSSLVEEKLTVLLKILVAKRITWLCKKLYNVDFGAVYTMKAWTASNI